MSQIRRELLDQTKQVLIAIDQTWNSVFWGSPDETISSRVGKGAVAGKWRHLAAEALINRLAWHLFKDPDHCRRAIEHDEASPPRSAVRVVFGLALAAAFAAQLGFAGYGLVIWLRCT